MLIAAIIMLCAGRSFAKVIRVPTDSATIQAGINGAVDGDTVLVADGTYTGTGNRNLDFGGKRIVLKSENGALKTVIDCERSGQGFYFHSGENTGAVVEGLTITRGDMMAGGGILCEASSPMLANCVFRENYGGGSPHAPGPGGGGIFCVRSSPLVVNCQFVRNFSAGRGGAICCDTGSAPQVEFCTFQENFVSSSWSLSRGGAIHCTMASPLFIHCTFYGNDADLGATLSCDGSSSPELEDCVVAFIHPMAAGGGAAVFCIDTASHPAFTCCNLYANPGGDWVRCIADQAGIDGNISANPLFCSAPTGDFTLAENSPCLPPNNSCGRLMGAFGQGCGPKYNRIWYVKADGTGDAPTIQAAIDSSAYEDTVLAASGVYTGVGNRGIDFLGKRIVLRSEAGSEATVIDCERADRGFFFHRFEDSTAILQGFTIQRGFENVGGGVLCEESSPLLVSCVLKENSASVYGGGIYSWGTRSAIAIRDCVFLGDSATTGGGLYCIVDKAIEVRNSTFRCNVADYGGAVCSDYGVKLSLINCTLFDNSADSGAGMWVWGSSTWPPQLSIQNCIIAVNAKGKGVSCSNTGVTITTLCTDIFDNAGGHWVGCIADQAGINGNFSLDPLFCDTAAGDFHLAAASPCNPWNNDCHVQIGALPMGCLCDCDSLGDVNLDGARNPVDVVLMVNFVYKGPLPPFPDFPDCPSMNGDWNCDDRINPVDVVTIVNYVYKSSGHGPCDPCQQAR